MAMHNDEDNFEEHGCTFDFTDDTDLGSGTVGALNTGSIYREYEGEDYSQYLDDDDDAPSPFYGYYQPGAYDANARDVERKRKSTTIIREKLGRLLLTGGTGRPRNAQSTTPQNPNYRIHEVSYADCKIGNTILDRTGVTSSTPGSDSGIDCRSGYSLETESDLGPQTSSSSSWWDMETLSSRRQTSSSASALELRRPSGHRNATSELSGPVVRNSQKSVDNTSSSDAVRKLSNPFRKIYSTLSRRKSANVQEMSYNPEYEDIRL